MAHKIKAFVRLMRPANCILMGFAVMVGAALADKTIFLGSFARLFLGFVTGFTITAASMVVNDYYDREIDAINEPNRPIPSGIVTPKQVLVFALFLTAIGFVAAFFTNMYCFALSIVAWIISVAYTTRGKATGLAGNVLVSLCVVIPFLYGSLLATQQIQTMILLFAAMVFLSNTGREINKGIVDIEGDKTRDAKTIAVRYGEKTAAIVAAILYVAAILLTPFPWMWSLVSAWFVPLVLVTDFGLVASSALLTHNHSRENAKKIKNYVLIWFLFGLLAFILGTI